MTKTFPVSNHPGGWVIHRMASTRKMIMMKGIVFASNMGSYNNLFPLSITIQSMKTSVSHRNMMASVM